MSQPVQDFVLRVSSILYDVWWQQCPTYLVWVIGLVLAWRRRRLHPKPCLALRLALAGFLLYSLVGTFLGAALAATARVQGWSQSTRETLLAVSGVADSLVMAVLWALVLVAALGWRQPPAA